MTKMHSAPTRGNKILYRHPAVRESTDGSVDITVHLSGEVGVKITEKLSAVENGIVQMADMLLFLQAGEAPFLGIDTLPYLIQGQDEMKSWLEVAGPKYDDVFTSHNQKVLYYVPWPSPGIYTKEAVVSADDIKGLRIRAFNATSTSLNRSPVTIGRDSGRVVDFRLLRVNAC